VHAADAPTRKIGLDRQNWAGSALVAALLLWPLVIFGRPAYFIDSLSYLKGGAFAVRYAATKIQPVPPRPEGRASTAQPNPAASAPAAAAKGARSIPYSIFSYLLAWPGRSMAALAVAQAILTALLLQLTARIVVRDRAAGTLAGGAVALVTPVAIFTCYAMPDIFAGVTILATLLLMLDMGRLTRGARWLVGILLAAAISFHASHLPLSIGLAAIAVALRWYVQPGHGRAAMRLAGVLLCPILLAVAVTLVASWVGYGQASVEAKRFPLTLARSIEDGPARWLLQQECRRPRFAVCELYGTAIPSTVADFLWGSNGIAARATPDQLDRIRAEEHEIVILAAQRYPREQASRVSSNFLRQLITFSDADNRFDWVVTERGGTLGFDQRPHTGSMLLRVNWAATILSCLGALLVLLMRFRRASREERATWLLVLCGLAFNAAICVIFSGVTDRYQARVIWTLPFVALLFAQAGQARSEAPSPSLIPGA
jgi:hypothetical protein